MSPLILILSVVGAVVITAVVGFATGMIFERWYISTAMARASKRLGKLVDHVAKSMENTEQACRRLATMPDIRLSSQQSEKLLACQNGLLSAIGSLGEISALSGENSKEAAVTATRMTKRTPVSWQQSPIDERSQIPDFSAFETNLKALLGSTMCEAGGLVLVQIDRFEQLLIRFGDDQADHLMRSMARLLISSMRDDDLVCHLYDDTFCVLLQDIDFEEGREVAHQIRQTVRSHRFRLEHSDKEIHMTASFGYYKLSSGDCFELALERATTALSDSRKKGRNQLYAHNGLQLSLCHAG